MTKTSVEPVALYSGEGATWYEVVRRNIFPVQVVHQATTFLMVSRPASKFSDSSLETLRGYSFDSCFPTWELARKRLLADLEIEIFGLHHELEAVQKLQRSLENMTSPIVPFI